LNKFLHKILFNQKRILRPMLAFNVFIKRIGLFLFLIPVAANAQILRDSVSLKLVKEGIDNIYNLRFDDAREICRRLNLSYPGHPDIYMIKGLITYWEQYPLIPSSQAHASFEKDLRTCIELCEEKHNPADDAEYLLANLSARGMLLLFYSDNDMNKEVIPLAISTYQYIRRSFNYTSLYTDFYFFTGLYNYYREAYPQAYPAYKALAFLFPKGDKIKGMNELHIAAKYSILFKAESSSFLSAISISFENNYEQAYEHSKYLHELYPANTQYLSMYIKNLLLIKQYNEAETHVITLSAMKGNKYFMAQLAIFNGILQEKKYHNNKLAEGYYLNGIKEMSLFGYYGNEFAAYGYFGLSRISKLNGDTNTAKTYRKKAVDLADFKKVDFD
jgi:hypothetical protein